MKIIDVLKIPAYLAIAVVSSLAFAAIYIYTQVLGIIENLDLWFSVIPWYNAILFTIFAALFGAAISFQIYNWRQPKTCPLDARAKTAGASGGATFIGLLVAQCPACASLGVLFLPVSAATFFMQFSVAINILSIALLLFTINYLGGFRK